jgi:AcrR family transcriptional regulator
VEGSAEHARAPGARTRPPVPIWARPHSRRRSTLSREAIVEAALKIADAEGIAAVSIRRVAAELGARTMSLYTHIDSKDDLLDLMANEVVGEVLIAEEPPADWRAAISLITRREREVSLRHPWIVDLVNHQSRGVVGPNALRHLEQSVAALAGLRIDVVEAWWIIGVIDDYMLGYVTREIRERAAPRSGVVEIGEHESLMQPYLQQLIDSGEFVTIAPLLKDGIPGAPDNFERGLGWILDGIERAYT